MLALFLIGEFLLHIPCLLYLSVGSLSYTSHGGFFFLFFFFQRSFPYTSRAGFIFILGVSLTDPMLVLFFLGEFLLHILCWLYFSVGSLSYTSHADFFYSSGEFLLHIPCWLYFLSVEFLLHIPYLLYFSFGNFSYTSHAGFFFFSFSFFFFIWVVSFIYPVPA